MSEEEAAAGPLLRRDPLGLAPARSVSRRRADQRGLPSAEVRLRPMLVTAVGRDRLGEELLQRLESWGIGTQGVAVDPDRSTGLEPGDTGSGSPEFEIATDVAWDCIELSTAVVQTAAASAAVVFGSLAQRSRTIARSSLRSSNSARPRSRSSTSICARRSTPASSSGPWRVAPIWSS